MTKIAVNRCYGGFGLSTEAVLLGRRLSNNPKWGNVVLKGEIYEDTGEVCDYDYSAHHVNVPRHDPILIQVIEQLGADANGRHSDICIATIDEDKYQINKYDGMESIMTPNTMKWTEVKAKR